MRGGAGPRAIFGGSVGPKPRVQKYVFARLSTTSHNLFIHCIGNRFFLPQQVGSEHIA